MNSGPGEVTLLVTAVLDDLAIPYYVAGSIASVIHGVVRTTMDADVVADVAPMQVAPLAGRVGRPECSGRSVGRTVHASLGR
jgi:hypothetical protein